MVGDTHLLSALLVGHNPSAPAWRSISLITRLEEYASPRGFIVSSIDRDIRKPLVQSSAAGDAHGLIWFREHKFHAYSHTRGDDDLMVRQASKPEAHPIDRFQGLNYADISIWIGFLDGVLISLATQCRYVDTKFYWPLGSCSMSPST